MIEIFAGVAILCATAKQAGMGSSIAIDKVKKKSARSSIIQLDLCNRHHRALLEEWLLSPLLLWIHIAPVCGTASRARDIRRFPGDPQPLRSNLQPEGLDGLSDADMQRVEIANDLFEYSCFLFERACSLGVIATMENPRNSYFWITKWVLALMAAVDFFCGDFQVCMLGGARDKWTRIIGNFPAVVSLNIKCDHSHTHEPWGFARDDDGRQVWATSLESRYPRKMCIALVQLVLQFAASLGVQQMPASILDASDPLQEAQRAQMSSGLQPKPSKVPPMVSESNSVAVFLVRQLTDIPCSLMSKLPRDVILHTKEGVPVEVPKHSRFLRFSAIDAPVQRGEHEEHNQKRQRQRKAAADVPEGGFNFEVAFGIPWTPEAFISQACKVGHPATRDSGVPWELRSAVAKHMEWSDEQMISYRVFWCRKWITRASELESAERLDAASRDPIVAGLTQNKRLMLTGEMLKDIGYEDTQALELLARGATLAGEIETSPAFERQYKPCLATLDQLRQNAPKLNKVILSMTQSSGSSEVDKQLLDETKLEVQKGWAVGPFDLEELEEGAVISRRFPLSQGSKTRMIDDYSISGINDSCTVNNKLDLHMVDTFCAVVKHYFKECSASGSNMELLAKTFDLKSAYRQVPIRPDHYCFSYFSVYNCETERAEIYQLRTMPFGATHSVYCFLRLSRALFSLAVRGLHLLTTNFYDDFILASRPGLSFSAEASMELLFRLTGWDFAQEGKKATSFSKVCKALGVKFDFSRSESGLLSVCNTDERKLELIQHISRVVETGVLEKQEALVLRGRLGFADSCVHGRLGKLVLKRLIDHAYGRTKFMDDDLKAALRAMAKRLEHSKPRSISAKLGKQFYMYTDACYETDELSGGLGGVLVDDSGNILQWFGFSLSKEICVRFGSMEKGTIIYELELLAAVLATALWCEGQDENFFVHFGDNDGVRFSLIRATSNCSAGQCLMRYQLEMESRCCLQTWYARVPTEANISDGPSRLQRHHLLTDDRDVTTKAVDALQDILQTLCNG